jgi:NAD(P)-dependent dehydrogenase (short-subunit alcohol dehydrogenase family)
VVVNDLGGSTNGTGADTSVAAQVADEIGGIPDGNDVSTEAGAHALIDAAVETCGRVDILINNAGIVKWAAFPDPDDANLLRHLAVHVGGSFNTTRFAWPHMAEQGFGRIVMTTSTGVLGLPKNHSYAAAKGGIIGLTRSLAIVGRPLGITVNAIAPAAGTRMGGEGTEGMEPELVAPMVAYLTHEDCAVSGEIYTAGAGRFARLFIASTEGYVNPEPTVEDVAAHWDAINAETGYYVPADLSSWSAAFLGHRPR